MSSRLTLAGFLTWEASQHQSGQWHHASCSPASSLSPIWESESLAAGSCRETSSSEGCEQRPLLLPMDSGSLQRHRHAVCPAMLRGRELSSELPLCLSAHVLIVLRINSVVPSNPSRHPLEPLAPSKTSLRGLTGSPSPPASLLFPPAIRQGRAHVHCPGL